MKTIYYIAILIFTLTTSLLNAQHITKNNLGTLQSPADWNDANNWATTWSGNTVLTSFPNNQDITVTIGTNSVIELDASLIFGAGCNLTVKSGATLIVTGLLEAKKSLVINLEDNSRLVLESGMEALNKDDFIAISGEGIFESQADVQLGEKATISLINGGTMNVAGNLTVDNNASNKAGTITGSGTINISGTIVNFGPWDTTIAINYSNFWTGNNGTDWEDGGNWSVTTAPKDTSYAIIPKGLTNYPILTTTTPTCKNLLIENGAIVTINPTAMLKVNGDLTVNGTMTIDGNASNTGALWLDGIATGNVSITVVSSRNGWNFFSSPLANFNNTFPYARTYNEPAANYWDENYTSKGAGSWNNVSGTTDRGIGFISYMNTGTSLVYKGTPDSTSKTITATHTPNDIVGVDNDEYFNGWVLIGNPFTVPVKLSTILGDNPSLEQVAYFRNENDYNVYARISDGDARSTYPITLGDVPEAAGEAVIPVGQCIYAKITNGTASQTTENLVISSNSRTAGNNPISPNKKADTQSLPDYMHFRMESTDGKSDETAFYFMENRIDGYNDQDVLKMMGSNGIPNIYINSGSGQYGVDLAIDGFPMESLETGVDMGIRFDKAGTHTLILKKVNFDPTYNVLLEDTETGAMVDIINERSYTFTVDAQQLVNRKRFKVHFRRQLITAIGDETAKAPEKPSSLDIKFDGSTVMLSTEGYQINASETKVLVADAAGKIVVPISTPQANNTGVEFQFERPQNTMYIIYIKTKDFKVSFPFLGQESSRVSIIQ